MALEYARKKRKKKKKKKKKKMMMKIRERRRRRGWIHKDDWCNWLTGQAVRRIRLALIGSMISTVLNRFNNRILRV